MKMKSHSNGNAQKKTKKKQKKNETKKRMGNIQSLPVDVRCCASRILDSH